MKYLIALSFVIGKIQVHTLPLALVLFGMVQSKVSKLKGHLLLADQNKQLEETNTALSRQNKLKDRLLAIISHDVRSPLNSLKSLLHLFKNNSVTPSEFQEVALNLECQVEQLSSFLENLLRWVKHNRSQTELVKETIDLQLLAKDTIQLLLPIAQQKRVQIHCNIPAQLNIFSDAEIIKLILRNLIGNAIKFCYPNDHIFVEAQQEHSLTRISVRDTGVGISAEKMSSLFHLSGLTTKGTKGEIGLGLGLSLCTEFIENLGGKIHATSIEGHGSCFEFTIPFTHLKNHQKMSVNGSSVAET